MKFIVKISLALLLISGNLFADKQNFKIGLILTTIGEWGEYGEAQRNAIELARKQQPKNYTNIQFIYEDCSYAPRDTVASFKKLVQIDKVDLVFVWGVEPSLAVAPLAIRYKQPTVVSAIDDNTSRNNPYVVRSINYAEQYAKKMAEFLTSKNFNRLGVIQSEISYHDILLNGLKKNLSVNQSVEIVESVLPTDRDFSTIVAKVKAKNYDALGLYLSPSQILQFLKQAEAQRLGVQYFGMNTLQSDSLILDARSALDGTFYVHNFVEPNFHKQYLKSYGNDIQIPWAANAYDFAIIAGQLFNSGKLSKQEILNKLQKIPDGNGAGGKYQLKQVEEIGYFLDYEIKVFEIHSGEQRIVY